MLLLTAKTQHASLYRYQRSHKNAQCKSNTPFFFFSSTAHSNTEARNH